MKHEEFLKLRDARAYHMDVMEIGVKYRDGSTFTQRPDERVGYIIERVDKENFRLTRELVTDVPTPIKAV